MGKLLRHRQTKGPVSARLHLNCRATPRLHQLCAVCSPFSPCAQKPCYGLTVATPSDSVVCKVNSWLSHISFAIGDPSWPGRKKLTPGAEAQIHFQRAPPAASFALSTVMTSKVFISQRPGGVARTLLSAQTSQVLLLFPPSSPLKYLFFKDLAGNGRK